MASSSAPGTTLSMVFHGDAVQNSHPEMRCARVRVCYCNSSFRLLLLSLAAWLRLRLLLLVCSSLSSSNKIGLTSLLLFPSGSVASLHQGSRVRPRDCDKKRTAEFHKVQDGACRSKLAEHDKD